jgi:hypothetical protein
MIWFDAQYERLDLQSGGAQDIMIPEMSGIFFDLPSVRFLRRFRFLEAMLATCAASLFRWLTPKAFGVECAGASRRVHSRYDEAEFPPASSRDGGTCKKFDSALEESRAMDGVPSLFGALRPFDNWKTGKHKHELLFIRKTPTPRARWGSTQRKSGTRPGTAATGQDAEKDILATSCRVLRKRRRKEEGGATNSQRRAAFAAGAQARAG